MARLIARRNLGPNAASNLIPSKERNLIEDAFHISHIESSIVIRQIPSIAMISRDSARPIRSVLPLIALVLASLAALNPSAKGQWSHKEGGPVPTLGTSTLRPYMVQSFTKAEWEASNFAHERDLQWFRDAKFGMFVHFGLSTHEKADISWGTCYTRKLPDTGHGPVPDDVWQAWPKEFRLENFSARELVETAQAAGCKYIVIIAKHHEGFHLWDTAFSEFKITNTPFGRDYLKEVADACHQAQLPFGIYYSQRDWYHPDYMPVDSEKAIHKGNAWFPREGEKTVMGKRHQKYIKYQFDVCRELCTKYGKVDVFWWDAVSWGGMFTPEMWDAEKLTRMVRELQPGILLNNRCSVPGDFDTPEQRLGSYQDWRPWESAMCLERAWSYSGQPPKSLETIIRMIINNSCGDGNVLLSWGPKWDGSFDPAQKSRLLEVGRWLKENGASIYGTRGGPWKQGPWGGSTRRGTTAWLHVTQWHSDSLRLPVIPGRKAVFARLFNGPEIPCNQSAESVSVTVSAEQRQPLDTIVELTFDQSLDGLPAVATASGSLFTDAVTFGKVISRQAKVKTSSLSVESREQNLQFLVAENPSGECAIETDREANPWVQLDLGRALSVNGIRLLNNTAQVPDKAARDIQPKVFLSVDGKEWKEIWRANRAEALWEVPVTEFRAGAEIPGRQARYVRVEIAPAQPERFRLRQVEIFGKDHE